MSKARGPASRWNLKLIVKDMEDRGWLRTDLARHASVSDMTVKRFFSGEYQTARTVKKMADALQQPVRRYRAAESKRRLAS